MTNPLDFTITGPDDDGFVWLDTADAPVGTDITVRYKDGSRAVGRYLQTEYGREWSGTDPAAVRGEWPTEWLGSVDYLERQ